MMFVYELQYRLKKPEGSEWKSHGFFESQADAMRAALGRGEKLPALNWNGQAGGGLRMAEDKVLNYVVAAHSVYPDKSKASVV